MFVEKFVGENFLKKVFQKALFKNFSVIRVFWRRFGDFLYLLFQKKASDKTIILFVVVILCSCAPRGSWDAYRGESAYLKQKYKRAVTRLERAYQKGYNAPGFNFMLGSSYLYTGRYEEAVKFLYSATDESASTWFALGNAYYNMNDYVGAANAFRKALAIKPDFLEAIEALAMLYPHGRVTREEALALWKRALEMEIREEWITRAKHYIEQLEGTSEE